MKSFSLVIIGVIFLSGCYDPNYMQYHYPPPEGEIIEEAPPEPLVEVIPPLPYNDAIWVDGYWNWAGQRYIWVTGRYMRSPRVGVVWFPGGYVRSGRGYVYARGRWAPPSYRPPYRYVHRSTYPSARGYRYQGGPGQPRNYRYQGRPGQPRYYQPTQRSQGYAPSRSYRGAPSRYTPGRGRSPAPSGRAYPNQNNRPNYTAPSKTRRSAPPADGAPSKVRKSAPPAR